MDIFKYIAIGFIGMVMVVTVKNIKPEYSIYIALATGVIILISLSETIMEAVNTFSQIADKSGLSTGVFNAILRIIGIGYITEYSASLCEDNDCSSIAKKIQFAGKVAIFVMAMPILSGIIDIVGGLL
ncbi:MAG: SpoIIIAC/SpoIIIAD family protein [Bacillota bacterium]|jgi:stage III sporulation protein AD|nr:SpoIIIAC/SpoIIIAD family protein [Bacillota bacterium]HHU42909.1 stage III sporulation protein AD [Clostridiales bacterium]